MPYEQEFQQGLGPSLSGNAKIQGQKHWRLFNKQMSVTDKTNPINRIKRQSMTIKSDTQILKGCPRQGNVKPGQRNTKLSEGEGRNGEISRCLQRLPAIAERTTRTYGQWHNYLLHYSIWQDASFSILHLKNENNELFVSKQKKRRLAPPPPVQAAPPPRKAHRSQRPQGSSGSGGLPWHRTPESLRGRDPRSVLPTFQVP
jgi:hypothetical protein